MVTDVKGNQKVFYKSISSKKTRKNLGPMLNLHEDLVTKTWHRQRYLVLSLPQTLPLMTFRHTRSLSSEAKMGAGKTNH